MKPPADPICLAASLAFLWLSYLMWGEGFHIVAACGVAVGMLGIYASWFKTPVG